MPAVKKSGKAATLKVMRENLQDLAGAQVPSLQQRRSTTTSPICQKSEADQDKDVNLPPVVQDKQAGVTAACTMAEEQRGSEVPVPAVSQEMEDGGTPMPFQKPTGSTDSRGSVSYPDSFYTGRDPV